MELYDVFHPYYKRFSEEVVFTAHIRSTDYGVRSYLDTFPTSQRIQLHKECTVFYFHAAVIHM